MKFFTLKAYGSNQQFLNSLMKKKILICGAGGFIGGHLVNYYLQNSDNELVCADIKPEANWFQIFDKNFNFLLNHQKFTSVRLKNWLF